MKLVPVIVRASGINNKVDPGSIGYDLDNGIADLATAVNVVITDKHRIERRQGRNKIADGEFHSIYSHASNFTAVIKELSTEAALMRVNKDYSLTGLRDGLTKDKRTAFVRAGFWYYYCNGVENGVVKEDGLSYIWPTYDAPTVFTRSFSPAPVGDHLAFFSGMILVSVGDTIYRSEPHEPGLFDLEQFNRFTSKVLMIKPVLSGVFVSTEEETLFLPGTDPQEWESIPVLPYPALEWSEATDYIPATRLGIDMKGNVALWVSKKGVIAGLPSGDVINLTEDKIVFEESTKAASMLYKDKIVYTMR